MKDGQDAFWKIFGLLKLQSDSSESQIENASTVVALVADDGIRIGARHGDAFRFALNGVECFRLGRGSLLR